MGDLHITACLAECALHVLLLRHLYEPDGRFTDHHIQDWQHSAMYLAFMLAGFIDMMAHYTQLPSGIDQVLMQTAVAFVYRPMLRPWSKH